MDPETIVLVVLALILVVKIGYLIMMKRTHAKHEYDEHHHNTHHGHHH